MNEPPLREPTFLILTALADEPRHGYAVIEEVEHISAGSVRLRAGTLYAALDRLRADGLIEVDREEVVQTRLRRYYRITAEGARRLAADAARMRRHATAATRRLGRLAGGAA
jgi:DNA-binding PadR family transcriptional regulator